MIIIRPLGWANAYFGPYTPNGAWAALERLLRYQNKANHSSCNFTYDDLHFEEIQIDVATGKWVK